MRSGLTALPQNPYSLAGLEGRAVGSEGMERVREGKADWQRGGEGRKREREGERRGAPKYFISKTPLSIKVCTVQLHKLC